MAYGIGRVPKDVDPTSEAMAEVEAAEGKREQCPERAVNLTIYRSHTPGSAVMCERHWLEYHHSHGQTVAEVLDYYKELAQRTYRCARCGRAAHWNSGAGEALCTRHWDEY